MGRPSIKVCNVHIEYFFLCNKITLHLSLTNIELFLMNVFGYNHK